MADLQNTAQVEISHDADATTMDTTDSIPLPEMTTPAEVSTPTTEVNTEVVELIEEPKEEKKKDNTELEKYWKPVRSNPGDFTGWTYLLQYVEQEGEIDAAREGYEEFLAHYPYCYGYWKKYADIEKRHNNLDQAIDVSIMTLDYVFVFERGVQSIPLSSELWLHYIQFYIKELKNVEGTRKLYERAITAAGTDFRSDKLWDNYINWEKMTDLQRILDLDEFIRLRLEVVSETDPSSLPPSDDAPPGEEAPPGIEPGDDKEGGSLPGDVEEINKVRDKILKEREVAFKQNEEEVSKRWTFEEGRPYFHVKPLERSQLKNWREYLDFEIQNGMHERVVVLFERSMIATALYEDFWLKKAAEDTEKTVQLDEQCLQAVRSRHNDAWKILSNLEEVLPGMVMVAMRRISLERRIGNREKTEILFQEYIEKASDLNVRAFYVIKYARYMFKVLGDEIRARKILMDALEKDPECYEDHQKLIKDLQAADKKRKAPEAGANGTRECTTTVAGEVTASTTTPETNCRLHVKKFGKLLCWKSGNWMVKKTIYYTKIMLYKQNENTKYACSFHGIIAFYRKDFYVLRFSQSFILIKGLTYNSSIFF
ncbi:PRP39-like protein [Mya arenaria]|uniref:PRP39-like protein n=1 Tax=Mya arenaria TaxID=6604 RepID=A0ABY7FHH8_MYAAR|nr:PRP39-like protein [Mya arenaria]